MRHKNVQIVQILYKIVGDFRQMGSNTATFCQKRKSNKEFVKFKSLCVRVCVVLVWNKFLRYLPMHSSSHCIVWENFPPRMCTHTRTITFRGIVRRGPVARPRLCVSEITKS